MAALMIRLSQAMFWQDHAPPHFHALYGEYEVLINICTLEVIQGDMPRRALALVLEWNGHRSIGLNSWRIGSYAHTTSHSKKFIRQQASPHLSTRQYARIIDRWVSSIGLDPTTYGTFSMRRTKATLIYKLRSIHLIYEWFISKIIHRVAMQPARLLHIKDRAPWVLTAFEPAASAIRSYG